MVNFLYKIRCTESKELCIVLRLCLSYIFLEEKKTVIISYNVKKKKKTEVDCQVELTVLLMLLLAYAIQKAKNYISLI